MIWKLMILMSLFTGSGQAALGQNLIVNSTFDTDIGGWETTSASTGVAEWEPALGQPPGALRLVGPDEIALTTACYPAVPGRYFLRADGYMRTIDDFMICGIDWALYSSTDCTGSFAIFTQPPLSSFVFNPNQWESLEYEHAGAIGGLFGTTRHSVRPFLNKFGDFMGDDACIFDNVSLEIQPLQNVTAVPVLSPVGLALFTALTLGAGFVALRRR